jgi:hypothetical protein
MQAIMQQPANRRNFFAFLTAPNFTPREILEPDFDDDANKRRPTAEPLDWHECRHWPALAMSD